MFWTPAFALILLCSTICAGHAEEPVTIDVVEYGIYMAEIVTSATGVNAEMKPAKIKNICHVMTTKVVPARDHLNFGFRFHIGGQVSGQVVSVKKTIRFPDHTKPPGSRTSYVTNENTVQLKVGATSYSGWAMWQTHPGTWTFQLSVAGRLLVEENFTVVEKNGIHVVPDGDSTCFQMSSRSVTHPSRS
jgi:hypothetical protein